MLRMDGYPARAIHGDKSQNERDMALAEFKSGTSPILVATDVAARGLDVKDIQLVVNYDFPNNIEDYVHRIGRTGRAGAKGTAITLFTSDNNKQARDLVKLLQQTQQYVPPELQQMSYTAGPTSTRGGGKFGMGKGSFGYSAANNVPLGGATHRKF